MEKLFFKIFDVVAILFAAAVSIVVVFSVMQLAVLIYTSFSEYLK